MFEMTSAFKEIARTGADAVKNKGLQMNADAVRRLSDTVENADKGFRQLNREVKDVLTPDGCNRLDIIARGAHDVSFRGGLSASQGISMIASRKTNEARKLFSKASSLRTDGLHKQASQVENKARNVMQEANNYQKQAYKLQVRAEEESRRHRAEAEARIARAKAHRQAKEAEQARIKAMRIAEEKARAKAAR